MRLAAYALCLAAIGAPALACETVRFNAGAVSHSVTGTVIGENADCYSLSVRAGQQFRVEVLDGVPLISINGADYVYSFDGFAGRSDMTVEVIALRPNETVTYRLLFTVF